MFTLDLADGTDNRRIDAGGLTALLSLHQWCRERNIQLKLVNPWHFVQKVLTLTQLDRILDISQFDPTLFAPKGGKCQALLGANNEIATE